MRRFVLFAAAALVLTACNPRAVEQAGCAATATAAWGALQIDAASEGASCDQANAIITIRGESGATLWTETYPAAQVMILAPVQDANAMRAALAEWIALAGPEASADLPEWVNGEDYPISGDFPFLVEEGIDRAAYEALRTRDVPVYCYVQGMESSACLAYENGAVTKIGVQTFPG